MKSPVQLYLRVRLPDGTYSYLKAAYTRNGRIRPHHAIHNLDAVHFPGSAYYLRFQLDGKRVMGTNGGTILPRPSSTFSARFTQ
jgi:integrase/recombinase XerD